ncbi:MAG: hypothetical protein I3273_05095 [Candidatus Moeniiplasma glomeromycotorum]|nr:hypothetical protein [Candidatus Moeniiplasma glomeromycotorum]MCE8169274.1 hypothetical protein [Candidatus Moeniiplasma glomeromycotorum]MCE8169469.1 hypothetical protein [Candidatus Moeniiplasma glomeromycotorum]
MKVYKNKENDFYELLVESKRVAIFTEKDYSEIFEKDKEGLLVNQPKLEMPNSSIGGMTRCKLTFGDKVEFNFSLFTGTYGIFAKYLGKEQILIYPQIILKKLEKDNN